MSQSKANYHHGNLRPALIRSAMELIEQSGESALSLRAVARQAGVSPAAPYRHYADRGALVSAVAAVGYRELAERLVLAHPAPSTPEQLAGAGSAYVQFALERPALFRIMFGEACDRDDEERAGATEAVSLYLRGIAERIFPQGDSDALAIAIWALVHGLALLYLDGKLNATSRSQVADRVGTAIRALLTATGRE